MIDYYPNKHPRETYDRTTCGCDLCSVGCHTKPGGMLPGDIERIADYLHIAIDDLLDLLVATDGAIFQGARFPSIAPAQRLDGRCVFLDPEDKCSVHPVAPYGCSHFDFHMTPIDAELRSQAGLRYTRNPASNRFRRQRKKLVSAGRCAGPLVERQQACNSMEQALILESSHVVAMQMDQH